MNSELERLQLALPKRYTLLRELDRGGMSRVYLAREQMPDREVAIKVFDEKLSAQLGRERFLREVELTSQLGHPYIVPIHSAGDAEGALYYVMPFVRGESLRDRLEREGRLPIEDALKVTEQVAGALAHAHEKGVVHRDIKPANILFHGGHAVVADFGIARALSAAEAKGTLTHAGTSLGTPDYMSPEQIGGDAEVDERTDIYALACVLYEMLGGQPPFHSRTRQATLARHMADTVPSLTGLRDAVPHEVEDAIRRALAKSPVDRYASVSDFVAALRGQTAGTTPKAASPGKRPLSRMPSVAVPYRLAGLLLAAAAIGWAWNAWLGGDRSGASTLMAGAEPLLDSIAVPPFENLTGDPQFDRLGRFLAEDITDHLRRVGNIRVIESGSVVNLLGDLRDLSVLMDSLNINTLIEGHIRERGDSLEVRFEQTNNRRAVVDSDYFPPFPRERADSAERAIAHAIAERYMQGLGLGGTLVYGDERSSPAQEPYIHGTQALGERTPEGVARAVLGFREAIQLDSTYAPAYAGLAQAYALALYYKYDIARNSYLLAGRGLALADRAVELDPGHDAGYSTRGFLRVLIQMPVDSAEADFSRAQDIVPNDANAASWRARILTERGEYEEAYRLYELARSADPQNPGRLIPLASLALQLGQPETVIRQAITMRELQPTLWIATAFQGWALALAGRGADCLGLELGVYELVRAVCRHQLGQEEEAFAQVRAAEDAYSSTGATDEGYLQDMVVLQGIVVYYGYVGDVARATEWLRTGFERSPAPVDARIVESDLMAPVRNEEPFATEYDRLREQALGRVRAARERERARLGP